jgi:hypothetical protein
MGRTNNFCNMDRNDIRGNRLQMETREPPRMLRIEVMLDALDGSSLFCSQRGGCDVSE